MLMAGLLVQMIHCQIVYPNVQWPLLLSMNIAILNMFNFAHDCKVLLIFQMLN